MNITECAANLLTYFPEEQREIPDNVTYPGCNAAVRTAMNDALQELFGMGKPWVRRDERGVVLYEPATVDIQVTTGSTAAVIDPGDWLAWFAGCTVVITGADTDNQIRNATASAIRLKFPYSGTTGTVSCTIYHDCVSLDADVLQVQEPVRLDRRQLHPMNNPSANSSTISTEDYGFHQSTRTIRDVKRVGETVGLPQWFNVDTWSPSDAEAPRVRLRLSPAPSSQGFLEYTAMLTPPVVDDLESTDNLPIPFSFMESIFLPIAVKKLRKSPFWRSFAGEAEVEAGYQSAMALLKKGDPKRRSGMRIVQKY